MLYPLPEDPQQDFMDKVNPEERLSVIKSKTLKRRLYADKGQANDSSKAKSAKFLVLGCHFSRPEKPFIYDAESNTYSQFDKDEIYLDMYRSNDVV